MTDRENTPAIRTRGLQRRFGAFTAVAGLDLEIPRGSVCGFLGRNGAGKTTTIRMLLGLLRRDGGRVEVLDLDPECDALTLRRRVGYVPDTPQLYDWMTVAELTRFTGSFYPRWNRAGMAQLLEEFGLRQDRRVKELSRGMAAQLALTLALGHDPELLILDEPAAGLDVIVRRDFLESIVRLIQEEGRVLVVSGFVLFTILATVPRLLPRDVTPLAPVGRLALHAETRDLALNRDRVHLLSEYGLSTIDVSDRRAPSLLSTRDLGGRRWHRLLRLGDRLCATGVDLHRRQRPWMVACFGDGDETPARVTGDLQLPVTADDVGVVTGVAIGEHALLSWVTEGRGAIASLVIDEEGRPRLAQVLQLPHQELPPERLAASGQGIVLAAEEGPRPSLSMAVHGDAAIVALPAGFTVIDASDPYRLRRRGTFVVGDRPLDEGSPRPLAVRGDTVFVRQLWPAQILVIDITDLDQPVRIGTRHTSGPDLHPLIGGYLVGWNRQLFDPAHPYARPRPALAGDGTAPAGAWRHRGAHTPVIAGGLAYQLADGVLRIYELPPLPFD